MIHKYESDVVLGEKYVDEQTGIKGTAIALSFFQHGCERVTIETVIDNKIEEYGFDAPRLTNVETGKVSRATDNGGPMRGNSHRKHPGATR